MKRKRFIKLCMGTLGLIRNEANAIAAMVREGGLRFRIRSNEDAGKECEAEKEICKA